MLPPPRRRPRKNPVRRGERNAANTTKLSAGQRCGNRASAAENDSADSAAQGTKNASTPEPAPNISVEKAVSPRPTAAARRARRAAHGARERAGDEQRQRRQRPQRGRTPEPTSHHT